MMRKLLEEGGKCTEEALVVHSGGAEKQRGIHCLEDALNPGAVLHDVATVDGRENQIPKAVAISTLKARQTSGVFHCFVLTCSRFLPNSQARDDRDCFRISLCLRDVLN
jgi:hypothetical protein